jgi:hypothetical protein
LLDAAPVVRSMATQLHELKSSRTSFVRRVLALSESVTSATNDVLAKAKSCGGVPLAGGVPARGGGDPYPPV